MRRLVPLLALAVAGVSAGALPGARAESELAPLARAALSRAPGMPSCAAGSGPDRLEILETPARPHPFKPAGSVCLDEGCGIPPAAFAGLLQGTLQTGLACLADLSEKRLGPEERARWAAIFREVAHSSGLPHFADPPTGPASSAARHALQLLLLHRGWPGTSRAWEPGAQTAVEMQADPPPAHPVVWEPQGHGDFPVNGPALYFCADQPNARVRAKNRGLVMTRQSSFEEAGPGRQIYASASGPGTPGWPLVRVHPVVGDAAEGAEATKQALFFHEFFHLIGYAHEASVFTRLAGPHVPLPTACQVCCFPTGFARPTSPQCGARAREQLKHRACEICAGDHATSHIEASTAAFRQIARDFERSVKSCYFNLNPL